MNAVVVNLRRVSYDVYIGRAGHGLDGYFGNPIRFGRVCPVCSDIHEEDERADLLRCFEVWARARIARDPAYRERVRALHGKRLGCFCAPKTCHGDILARLAAELQEAA